MIADLAARLEGDVAVGVDVGDLGVRRVVVADRGDVAGRAVGQWTQDDELLRLGRGVQDPGAGQDLEPDGGGGVGVVLGPLGDPVVEELVGLGAAGQPQAPLVGELAQRLAEDQAGRRRRAG